MADHRDQLSAGETSMEENSEQQRLELETLLAIYPEEITVLKTDQEFLVFITPKLEGNVKLLLPSLPTLHPSHSDSAHPSPPLSSTLHRHTQVTHLPPLALYVRYRDNYPSSLPPHSHLSARWLDPKHSSFVVEKLQHLFIPDNPVVFDWITYLQDEFVSEYCSHQTHQSSLLQASGEADALSCDATSNLACSTGSESAVRSNADRGPSRLFLRSTSQMNDIEEFDQFESHREFQEELHLCEVCCFELPGREFCEPCVSCSKLFCKSCIREYCQRSIKDGAVSRFGCPDPSCESVLSDPQLLEVLPEAQFKEYLRLREELQLDSIPGMIFCPRPWCGARVVSEPGSNLAVCPECQFPFCKVCRQTWHGPGSCPALDKISNGGVLSVSPSQMETVAKSDEQNKRRIEELKTLLWMRSPDNAKPCPKCHTVIQKGGGCNKMTCRYCKSCFCWLCGDLIAGYSHFEEGRGCKLFRVQDYGPPTEREDITAPDNQQILENALMSKCPRCDQVESKTNDNNWKHCRKCRFQYCHLCREACYGLWHFSQYGCQQYTSVQEDLKNFENT